MIIVLVFVSAVWLAVQKLCGGLQPHAEMHLSSKSSAVRVEEVGRKSLSGVECAETAQHSTSTTGNSGQV